jgi:hypothetical protein
MPSKNRPQDVEEKKIVKPNLKLQDSVCYNKQAFLGQILIREITPKCTKIVVTFTTLVDFGNSISRPGPKTFRNRIVKPNLKRLYSVCYNKQAFLEQILVKESTPK